MIGLSYSIKMWAEVFFVLSQCTHLTDRQISIARPCVWIRGRTVKMKYVSQKYYHFFPNNRLHWPDDKNLNSQTERPSQAKWKHDTQLSPTGRFNILVILIKKYSMLTFGRAHYRVQHYACCHLQADCIELPKLLRFPVILVSTCAWYDVLWTAHENFTVFTTYMQLGTEMLKC